MIGVVVLGYNSKQYLKDCFDSVRASEEADYTLYFVDNGSSDSSIEYVKENYKDIKVIDAGSNLGFTGGNNLGIERALSEGAEYIFLLNPDTILDKNCLRELSKRANPKEIFQPLILIFEGGTKTPLINTAGNYVNFLGFSYCNGYREPASKYFNENIVSASGAGLFAPRQMYEKIGLLDKVFFMYHEDLDLCWRARLVGYNVRLVTEARMWHKYTFARNNRKMFYVERNRLLFLEKNFSGKYLALILPIGILNEILMCLFALRERWLIVKLRACGSALRYLPYIWRERVKFGRMKKLRDRDMAQFIRGGIRFDEINVPLLGWYNRVLEGYWKIVKKLL